MFLNWGFFCPSGDTGQYLGASVAVMTWGGGQEGCLAPCSAQDSLPSKPPLGMSWPDSCRTGGNPKYVPFGSRALVIVNKPGNFQADNMEKDR